MKKLFVKPDFLNFPIIPEKFVIGRQCQKSTREKVEYRKMKSKCHGTCYLEAGICDKTEKMKKEREKRAEKPP